MLSINIELINLKGSPELPLLLNINLQLKAGYVYTIIGKNGDGKTTLLKSITNLLDKNKFEIKGSVSYNDINLLQMSSNELMTIRQNKIKYVFQDSLKSFDQLKKLKYYFNMFGNKDEVCKLLEHFKLPSYNELESHYPYELSYGMAQRLGFIFALVSKPEIFLMDEPTSSLDTEIIDLFREKIIEYAKGQNATVLMVTHDIFFAKDISDYLALIENKTIDKFLPKEEFFKINFKDYNS